VSKIVDRLCGLVVRVPGYRSRGPAFDSQGLQIFWEVVDLERGPLSLVRIIEELLEWKSSGSGQENRINDLGEPLLWPRDTLYPDINVYCGLLIASLQNHFIGLVGYPIFEILIVSLSIECGVNLRVP
jgi:hypothetical protein